MGCRPAAQIQIGVPRTGRVPLDVQVRALPPSRAVSRAPALLTARSRLRCVGPTGVPSERQENAALASAAENTRKQARALVAAAMVPNAVIFAALRVLRTADWLAAACGTGWARTGALMRDVFD